MGKTKYYAGFVEKERRECIALVDHVPVWE
jgi:hypothetical protein